MVEASKKKARAQVRRASTPAKQLPKRLKMSPASTIVVDRPWQVERRRKVVQGRSKAYAEHLTKVAKIVKSRTALLRAKQRGR